MIPVLVVAGFLGSGKTTLLNHLLRTTSGTRIGVIVNDFGRINIDAMTVAAQVDSMVTLGNGCLCCAVDVSDLDEMLGRLARPDAPIDVIVIEASGLAEPPAMLRLVLNSENPHITYGGLVEVVDAAEFETVNVRHPELRRHLRYADLVLLNKIDRVDAAARARLLALIHELTDGTPVFPVEHGRIDPALLFDPVHRPDEAGPRQLSFTDLDDHSHDEHAHASYQSVEFSTGMAMSPRRFTEFLGARPAGIYRMKGFVHFGVPGHGQRFTLHTVGGHVRFTRDPWPRGTARATQLVMIGTDLDRDLITKQLTAATEPDPASVDPMDMLSVTRFLPA